MGPGDNAKAFNVLREAAFKKTVAPDEVVGAIAFLEEEAQRAGGLPQPVPVGPSRNFRQFTECRPARKLAL